MTKTCLLLWLAVSLVAIGPAAKAASEPLVTAKGAFFALSVADLDTSAKWYSEKFGLKVVMQVPRTKDTDFAVTVLSGDGLVVELLQSDSAVSLSKAAPAVKDSLHVFGIVKAGLIVENFDKTVALLRARNVPIKMGPFPAQNSTGLKNLIIEDNSGNLIQFFGK